MSDTNLVHTHIAHIAEHHHIRVLSFILQEGRTETAVITSHQFNCYQEYEQTK